MAIQEFIFTSFLDCGHRESLEQMLFHNENQPKVSEGALGMIERYETPRISDVRNRLWITFDSGAEAQSLFVFEETGRKPHLVGVVVYTRENDVLAVVLLAVDESYAHGGTRADRKLFLVVLKEILGIARRIKGISSVKLYLTNPPLTISVAGAKSPAGRRDGFATK
jgi:hypothetical protein